MADAAGIENHDGPQNVAAVQQVIGRAPEPIQRVAMAVRDLIYDVYPSTVEVVWTRQGTVGWGVGPRKFTEQFCYLMCAKRHVTLGFYRGGALSDPEGLLPASDRTQVGGSLSMRSLRLSSTAEVERPALRALVEEAVQHLS